MSAEPKKFYLTTPIYYVNARPHIGHAYTTIVADVLARRHRLLGDSTFFLTGTDEHGQKIERSAAAAGIPPQQFADQVAAEFRTLWDRMGITYDKFIRTTDEPHKLGVQKLFRTLQEKGFIEMRSYTGTYCVSDETFVDVKAGEPCPDCGRITETVTEDNYFFMLSKFQLPLLNLIESGELKIENEARKNEVLSFLRGPVTLAKELKISIMSDSGPDASPLKPSVSAQGHPYLAGYLKDLSISRSSFKWGIPVPGDPKHVIYVWLDALTNYMTAIGYGSDDPKEIAQYEKFWPADLHLVGKEIIRFHCVYWPAFLLAADIPIPKAITAHGWLLFDNSKMSKSKGNIVRTETILDAFGDVVYGKQFPDSTKSERDLFASDVLRYFLLREIPFGQDGSFSFDALWERYNADLVNGYGNLVSRTLNLISQNEPTGLEKPIQISAEGTTFIQDAVSQVKRYQPTLSSNEIYAYAVELSLLIGHVDRYLSTHAPWRLAKESTLEARQKLVEVLYTAAEAIRILNVYLHPIMPFATAKVWAQLGLGDIELAAKNGDLKNLQWGGLKPGTKLGPLSPIFPRADKSLIEIMNNMENSEAKLSHDAPLKSASTPTPAAPEATNTTHPAAGPRPVHSPSDTLPVGGSTALTTGPEPTPHPAPVSLNTEPPSFINIDDFAKIELRVAQIVVAERIPKADKLLRLEVDLGPDFPRRQILSGIAEHYTPEELIGRRIVVITNLAPRKMRGLESHGMLLAASEGENGKPILATFAEDIALGSRLK
jgi:methionyl-tRNA synthetase